VRDCVCRRDAFCCDDGWDARCAAQVEAFYCGRCDDRRRIAEFEVSAAFPAYAHILEGTRSHLTIRALDEAGEVVADHTGWALIWSSDPESELHDGQYWVYFDVESQGAVNVEDVVPFESAGAHRVSVWDWPDFGVEGHLWAHVRADADRDGYVDHQDNCPAVFNDDQTDFDGDGLGDACDTDDDADGISDDEDGCDLLIDPAQGDLDRMESATIVIRT